MSEVISHCSGKVTEEGQALIDPTAAPQVKSLHIERLSPASLRGQRDVSGRRHRVERVRRLRPAAREALPVVVALWCREGSQWIRYSPNYCYFYIKNYQTNCFFY